MFIERLAVKGFRSLADVVWEPGKLNVLIGPNGGGKTNLLKVIRLLKASAAGKLGEFVRREGGMRQSERELPQLTWSRLDPKRPTTEARSGHSGLS